MEKSAPGASSKEPAGIHVIANKAEDMGQGTLHKDARSQDRHKQKGKWMSSKLISTWTF